MVLSHVKALANVLLLRAASRAGLFCTGRLLRSEQAQRIRQAKGLRDEPGWCLQGLLPYRMWNQAAGMRAMGEVAGHAHVVHAQGIAHLVLSHRAGTWEHRFVLPLLGQEVGQLVACGASASAILVSIPGGAALAAKIPHHMCELVRSNVAPGERQARSEHAVQACIEVAAGCLCAPSESSSETEPVHDLCVSVVAADETTALLRQLIEPRERE